MGQQGWILRLIVDRDQMRNVFRDQNWVGGGTGVHINRVRREMEC